MLTNAQVGGDPVTPVFFAAAGQEIRIRMLHPGGHPRNDNYLLHGHIWESEPYIDSSQTIGSNPLSNWVARKAALDQAPILTLFRKAERVDGFVCRCDYLYRTFSSFHFDGGIWGSYGLCSSAPCLHRRAARHAR